MRYPCNCGLFTLAYSDACCSCYFFQILLKFVAGDSVVAAFEFGLKGS